MIICSIIEKNGNRSRRYSDSKRCETMRMPPQIEDYQQIAKDICKVFSERLKALKDERSLTLEGIADIIGTSRQSVVYYTMGDRLPSIPVLISIATMFATTVDYLLGVSNERGGDKHDN